MFFIIYYKMDQFFSNIQSIISQDLEIISASSFKRQSKTTAPQEPLQKERKFFLFNTAKYVIFLN